MATAPASRPLPPAPAPPPGPTRRTIGKIEREHIVTLRNAGRVLVFAPPEMPKGAVPRSVKLAMDSLADPCYDYLNSGVFGNGVTPFIGFPALAQLSQRPEYRMMAETIAKEMTRKWLKVVSTGNADHKRIKRITDEMKRLKVRQIFKRALEHDGFYGRGQIFVDMGTDKLALPLVLNSKTFKKGSLRGFKNVEPMWSYPGMYDASNPMSPSYYVPQTWYVMGKPVHRSRMLTVLSREVSDILKPSYSFAGLSITQLAQDYVNNFIRTRNSVGDLLHSFSISILKTNMESSLSGINGGINQLDARAELFNVTRDNRGLMVIDKELEELDQINTPLTTVDHLLAQSQEQMASVAHIPLVKLLGVTPSGLNASSDGEMRAFYDWVASCQEDTLSDHVTTILQILQLNLFGEIDPDISFEWEPLWEMDDQAQASIRKTSAESDQTYVDMGAISPEEVRNKLAADPLSGYAGIAPDDMPTPPGEDAPDDTEAD